MDCYPIVAKLNKALDEVRTYLLEEDLQLLWEYVSPAWAGKFLDRWCTKALREIKRLELQVAELRAAEAARFG